MFKKNWRRCLTLLEMSIVVSWIIKLYLPVLERIAKRFPMVKDLYNNVSQIFGYPLPT